MAADSEETAYLQNREEHAIVPDDQVIDRADPLVLFVQNRLALQIAGPLPLRDGNDIHDDHFGSHGLRDKSDGTAGRKGDSQHTDAGALASKPVKRRTVCMVDPALESFNLVFLIHDIASAGLVGFMVSAQAHWSIAQMV
jgi:hypothetical protein